MYFNTCKKNLAIGDMLYCGWQTKRRSLTFRNIITQNIQEVNSWVQITHFKDGFLLQILWFAEVKKVVKLPCF